MKNIERQSILNLSKFGNDGIYSSRTCMTYRHRAKSDFIPPQENEESPTKIITLDADHKSQPSLQNVTSFRGFVQFIVCWCSDFYEEDFERDPDVKASMGIFLQEFMLYCGTLIEDEFDPVVFVPFVEFENDLLGMTSANLIESQPNFDESINMLTSMDDDDPMLEIKSPSLTRKISYDDNGEVLPPIVVNKSALRMNRNSTVVSPPKRVSLTSKRVSMRAGAARPRRRGTAINLIDLENCVRESSTVELGAHGSVNFHFNIYQNNAVIVAEQLSLMMHTYFCKIKMLEFISDNSHDNLTHFQKMHMQQMDWITSHILTSANVDECAQRIAYWLDVSMRMQHIRNYNGMFEILTVLQSTSIYRLKKSWSKVSSTHLEILTKLKALFNFQNNFAAFRNYFKENVQFPPCLPYVGLILKDIVYMKLAPKEISPGIINVSKLNAVSAQLRELNSYQMTPYHFDAKYEVIEALKSPPKFATEDEQYDASLVLEPVKT
jgi:hypothetical protein